MTNPESLRTGVLAGDGALICARPPAASIGTGAALAQGALHAWDAHRSPRLTIKTIYAPCHTSNIFILIPSKLLLCLISNYLILQTFMEIDSFDCRQEKKTTLNPSLTVQITSNISNIFDDSRQIHTAHSNVFIRLYLAHSLGMTLNDKFYKCK